MATQLAFLYILDSGCGERPINFVKDYRASWLGLGVLGKFEFIRTFITFCTIAEIYVLTSCDRKFLLVVVMYITTIITEGFHVLWMSLSNLNQVLSKQI
jgi:hypothetical protein